MKILLKILKLGIPFYILGVGALGFWWLMANKPEVVMRAPPVPILKVDAVRLTPQDYNVVLDSQGVVSARTESTLIPEVSGKILSVSPNFREGGFFQKDDVLLEIDTVDYIAAVTIAEANLTQMRLKLAEEEAASSQALRDWERLGLGEKPSQLVLREPQLAVARANIAAAEARVATAKRDLERTRITAPYDGRVLNQRVDVGQVVSRGNGLADVYAVDYAEIRLPLTSEEYSMLHTKPVVRGERSGPENIPVTLEAKIGQEILQWDGRVVRVEGSVDLNNRQIYVVAQVDDPYGPNHNRPLKMGLFVQAKLQGKVMNSVYALPRTALREGQFVLTIDANNKIKRVVVNPIWTTADEFIIEATSIPSGSLASLTQMTLAIDGMEVLPIVEGEAMPEMPKRKGPPNGNARSAGSGQGGPGQGGFKNPRP